MKNKKYLKYYLLAYLLILGSREATAKTLSVGTNGHYKTIASALASANNGDTIIISTGTYKEGELKIQKAITFLGKGEVILDGENKHQMLTVFSDHVTIMGIHFINSGRTSIRDIAALRIEHSNNCTIKNNTFKSNYFSIYAAKSNYCTISNNTIVGTHIKESNSGNGIHLWQSTQANIDNNVILGQRDGIYLEFVKNTSVTNNLSVENIRYGLHFMFSDGNSYENNTFKNNGAGVAVMYTKNIIMKNNHFEDNWGSASYGLLLKEINHSLIYNNSFKNNTIAIFMESCNKLVMKGNDFKGNGWAIKIFADCLDDTLIGNNFIGNTFDISTNGSLSNNLFANNYWDKYQGYDLDKDGIGDVPFRPVSLYSMIVEKIPNAIMLLRSVVADILDQVEKVQPDIIPASLVDSTPVMRMIKLPISTEKSLQLKDKKLTDTNIPKRKTTIEHETKGVRTKEETV